MFIQIREYKTAITVLLVILTISMIVPFSTFGVASAADPPSLPLKWTASIGGGGEDVLTADVLSQYPGEEVFHAGGSVAPNSGGRVSCLRGDTGAPIWTRTIANVGDTCQIQMVDMDNDGSLEIIVPLQQPAGLYILNAEDGSTMFSITNLGGGRIDSSPVAGDVDGDGYPDLFVGVMGYEEQPTTGKLIHYEYNAATHAVVERNRVQVWHPCAGGMSLADTDNDGTFELYMNERDAYFGDGSWGRGTMSFWADNLTERWALYGWGASSNIPMLADVNKDGIVDVVTTDLSSGVCVLNSTDGHPLVNNVGRVLSQTGINGRHNHYQSSIYDIDGDGNLEVLSGDGYEGEFDFITVFDLYSWHLDASIDTTIQGPVATRSWKGPTVGEISGDGIMDIIDITFDPNVGNNGQVQIYDRNYNLIYLNTGLRHRAIDAVAQDIDYDGHNELIVLTQGGILYCFDTPGIAASPRARSEVQFYSESRNGASTYVPYDQSYPDVSKPSPNIGALGVSTGVSSLLFTLSHPLGQTMSYTVTTTPNIGSGSGNNVGNGVKSVAISGLASSTLYHWQVSVTDQSGHTTNKYYSFTTGPYTPNSAPTQTTPSLTGSTTADDLVAAPQGTNDVNGNTVVNIYNWQKGGTSIANINLPFDTATDHQDEFSALATTHDYAYGANGIVAGATWVPNGKVGGAYLFDGTDFIRFPETSNRYDGGGSWSSVSLEMWVKSSATTSTERLIWKTDQYDSDYSYRLDYRNRGSSIEFTWYVSTTGGNYSIPLYSLTSNVADWHHVVCTYKSGVGLRLYIDSVEVAHNLSPTLTGNILNTSGPFEIAFRSGTDFAGYLDEVRLYPTEISSSMVSQRYLETKDGGSSSSTISKYDTAVGDTWRCQVTPNDGLADGSALNTATRTIGPDPTNVAPVASNLVIMPVSPRSTDSLSAQYTFSDANNDLEVGSIISWYKNGVFNVSTIYPVVSLPAGYAAKGQVWYFRVTPSDGFVFGTQSAASASVTILNAPPSFGSVTITPNPALQGNALTANSFGWFDPDGDGEGYTYQWQKQSGAVWINIGTAKTLAASNFAQGDTIKVIVTAFDGTSSGNSIEAQTSIIDSDPPYTGTPVVSGVRDDDSLVCTAVGTGDPDGDSVVNIYNWLRGGTSITGLYLPFATNSLYTAKDYSGNGNNGAITGATWTSQGITGGAYNFDGNDFIVVSDSASLGNSGTWSQITVEYWVNPSVDQKGTRILNKNGGAAGDSGLYMTGFNTNSPLPNTVFFGVTVGGGYEEATYQETYDEAATAIPTGVWSHVVGTYKSGDGIKLYINGALVSSTPGVGGNIAASVGQPLIVGYASTQTGTANRYLKGLLDEVRIYPTALSAAQVFQDYVDQKDGVNSSATIVPQETSSGQSWRCQVTPNDGWQDGTLALSNQVSISSLNTMPHIDWYSPADSGFYVTLGSSVDFKQVSSDANGSPLTYRWLLDNVQQATTQNWTYTPLSASQHTVSLEVSDGTTTLNHQWIVNVGGGTSYSLTVNTVGSGSVTLNPSGGSYASGTSVELTAVPAAGYAFSGWSGAASGTVNPTSVTMDSDKTVTATFTLIPPIPRSLTINIVGSGSVTKNPDQATYDSGSTVQLTAVPLAGYQFSGWSGALTGNTNPATITMDSDKTVTATFSLIPPTYTLTVNVVGSGSVTLNPPGGSYASGTSVQLTAVAGGGYVFSGWSGALTGTTSPASVTMDADKSVTATFTLIPPVPRSLTVNVVGDGSVTKNPDQATYDSGSSVQLTAVPSAGYQFSGWSGALSGTANPASITMDSDKTVTATFTQIASGHLLEDNFESGNLALWDGSDGGAAISTISPYEGANGLRCSLSSGANNAWSGVYKSIAGTNPVYLNAYVNFNAPPNTDNEDQWVLAFTQSTAGNALAYAGIRQVSGVDYWAIWYISSGTTLTYQVSSQAYTAGWHNLQLAINRGANDGWVEFYVDGVLLCSAYNLANSGRTLSYARVGFSYSDAPSSASSVLYVDQVTIDSSSQPQPTTYTLTTNTVGSGSVTRNPNQATYASGASVELTAVPAAGYAFSGWSGAASGAANPTSVTMDSDKTVTATFTLIPLTQYTLTTNVVGSGSIIKNPNQATYDSGTSVQLTAVADAGYVFSGWSGAVTGTTNPVSVTMDSDKSVTATFTLIPPSQYVLTTNVVGSGSITKNPDQATYSSGTSVELTAVPDAGYEFAGWSGALTGTTNPASVTMDSDKTVTATFTPIVSGPSDDFESGNLAFWDGSDGGAAISTVTPYEGTYDLQCSLSSGANNGWSGVYKSVAGTNPIYLSAQVQFNAVPNTDNEDQWVLAFTQNTAGNALAYAGIRQINGVDYWAIWYISSGTTLTYQVSNIVYTPGWHNLELAIYRGTSGDGWVEFYVDGTLVCSAYNLANSGRTLNYARVGFSYSDAPSSASSTVYIDNVTIDS